MTQQFDMVPLDVATLERIAEQLPKAREVKPSGTRRLFVQPTMDRKVADFVHDGLGFVIDRERTSPDVLLGLLNIGHELVLPERAREDHR